MLADYVTRDLMRPASLGRIAGDSYFQVRVVADLVRVYYGARRCSLANGA